MRQKKNRSMKSKRRIRSRNRLRLCRFAGALTWVAFSYLLLLSYIPDEIYLSKEAGETPDFATSLPVSMDFSEDATPVFGAQRVGAATGNDGILSCRLFHLLPIKQVVVHYTDRRTVTAAGTNIGIYLKNYGVLVVECASFTDESGALVSPSAYRIKSGDIIRSVDGVPVNNKEELMDAVEAGRGGQMVLEVLRGKETIEVAIKPQMAADGKNKLGVWVRDDIAGIGTMTFVTEDGDYGALGHGVSDIDTGDLVQIDTGDIYETKITGISKGKKGDPGEVTGLIQFRRSAYLGSVGENTRIGIFGKLAHIPDSLADAEQIPVGYKQEIEQGRAQIICSVAGERTRYDIEIETVDYHPREENKGIRYRVVDERLLAETGGIVQGMSGSPIIQNGKLIGAVTHVFVDDPTRGYGIFAERMLDEL